MYLLATFIFAWSTWKHEQTGILLFALLIGALTALRNRNWNWAGVWLALLLIKPNITLIPVVAIAVWLIRRGNWRPVAIMCVLTISLLVVSTMTIPNWYQPFVRPDFGDGLVNVLDGPQIVAIRINTTLSDWLKMLQIDDGIGSAIYASAIAISALILAAVVWRSESLVQVTIASLLVGFAITPYALQYDYPPLTLVLFWATALYPRSMWTITGRAAITFFIASVLFWERPISDGYWIVIGLIGLVIWSWWTGNKKVPPDLL